MSTKMVKLLQRSVNRKEVLTPYEALKWLEESYGHSMDSWRPQTIKDKVDALCLKNGYEAPESELIDEVNEWLRSN